MPKWSLTSLVVNVCQEKGGRGVATRREAEACCLNMSRALLIGLIVASLSNVVCERSCVLDALNEAHRPSPVMLRTDARMPTLRASRSSSYCSPLMRGLIAMQWLLLP